MKKTPMVEKTITKKIPVFDIQKAKKRIKTLRVNKHFTQEYCAEACGMSREAYNHAERSGSSVFFKVTHIHNLVFILETSLNFIYYGPDFNEEGESALKKIIEDQKNTIEDLKSYVKNLTKLNDYLEKDKKRS